MSKNWKSAYNFYKKELLKLNPKIAEVDPGYIAWAKENMTREPVKSLLAQM